MDNQEQPHGTKKAYTLRDFAPLIAMFAIVIAFTLFSQLLYGFTLKGAMNDFMAAFFIVFSVLKLITLKVFEFL